MSFEDHFSRLAARYAEHRPGYPPRLFEELAALVERNNLAWDCGTGNGQAAIRLAEHFDRVVATDASDEQIANAFPHPAVDYRVEPAEESSLETGSVDLTTVGIAVHWFDFERFYREVRRVSRPGALIAVWTYHLPTASPEIESWLRHFYGQVLDGYWPERLRYLDEQYSTLPFPFDEVEPPTIEIRVQWALQDLVGFVASWSGSQRYAEERGTHPLEGRLNPLEEAWDDPTDPKEFVFPLHLRIGRIQ